jgi:hypothetical protein
MTMSLNFLCSPQSVCSGGLRSETVQVLIGLLSLPTATAAATGHRRGGSGSGGSGQRVAVLLPVNLVLLSGSVNT